MKNKKKGNKARAARRKEETLVEEVKAPSIEVKTPCIEVKTPCIEVKTPCIEVKTSCIEVKTPCKEEVKPSTNEATSTIEVNTPSIEVETPCIDVKSPWIKVKTPCIVAKNSPIEVKSPSIGVNTPCKEVKPSTKEATSTKEVNTASKEVKTSSKEVESITVEVKMPSIDIKAPSENKTGTIMPSKEVVLTSLKVLPVPEDIKHPLENKWGFWLFTNEDKKNWIENLKVLAEFDTVEDYWCLYHHMKLPSELKVGLDYAVFKQGIKPMWEDKANKVGGRWFINLDRRGAVETNRIWLDVILMMIGENFKNSDMICGAVVNVRSKNRVSVWTRNKDQAANMEIGRKLKEVINFKLQFLDHKTNGVLYNI